MLLEEFITSFCDSKLSGIVSVFISDLPKGNSKNDQFFKNQIDEGCIYYILLLIIEIIS